MLTSERLITRFDRRVGLLLVAVGLIVLTLFGATQWVVTNSLTPALCVPGVTDEIGLYQSPTIEATC